jgi:DnaJ-class molecular chaperone
MVEHTYLDADGLLTDTRRCRACDGHGFYNRKAGEPVTCDECGGSGAAREEA